MCSYKLCPPNQKVFPTPLLLTFYEPCKVTRLEGVDEFEELLEAREAELQSFKPAPRETEADKRGDRRSLQRRLDQMLYLLVKKPRREHAWQMPQGGVEEGESLLEVGSTPVSVCCGEHK